jgi:2-polyprenyl-3-methyl-5-hydroxy-6-metoxy-1,4-benzoquinol methylase
MDLVKAGSALLRLDGARIRGALKERWRDKTFPNGMLYRGEVARFDRLYLIRDPWLLSCERERFRLAETNRLIRENFGRPRSLLEIGCGEGLQSSELQQLCDRLYGIDVSRRAVRRAKRRCPLATFAVADMFALPQPPLLTRFDVVTACEVLYYMADVAAALRRISELGRFCLISYYDGARDGMDQHVSEIPGVRLERACFGSVCWTLAWWLP